MAFVLAGGDFRAFVARHDLDLLRSDFFDAQLLGRLAGDEQTAELLEQARTIQRLFRIATDQPHADEDFVAANTGWAETLANDGLLSAHQIADLPEYQFVARHASTFGGAGAAREFHRRAAGRSALIKQLWAGVRETLGSAHYRSTRFANIAPSLIDYFEQIPSYQDLFGGLDYIVCPHCASIFSPAAYFLDLMRIIDQYVTQANPGTIPSGYTLAERRPDLFTRKLDCANTDVPVPFLSIVVDVLSARITQEINGDPLQRVAVAPFPFNLPQNEPIIEVRTNLGYLGVTLDAIWAALRASATAVERESLLITAEQYQQLTTVASTAADVLPLYGMPATGNLDDLTRVAVFLERTGLTREQLSALLTQDLSTAELAEGLAESFFINDTSDGTSYMQIVTDTTVPDQPFEKIANTSVERFDRLSRFIRLTAITGWSYAETDWGMTAAGAAEIAAAIPYLAALQQLRAQTGLPPDYGAALTYEVKTIGRGDGTTPRDMFDRVFNNPALLQGDPYGPNSQEPFDPARPQSWNPSGTTALDSRIRSRLTAALAVSDNDLTTVARYVQCLLGISTLQTDLATLSEFFRLTRIPQAGKIAVPDYLILLRMMYDPKADCIDRPKDSAQLTMPDVFAQLATIAWSKQSGFSAPKVQYILTGVAAPGVDIGYDPLQIRSFVNGLAAISVPARLTPASFIFEDLDASESAALFDRLAGAGILSSLGIVLRPIIEGTTLVEPVTFEDIAALLPVPPDFAAEEIGAADSQTAYAELIAHNPQYLIPLNGVAMLSEAFDASTDLSFLFPNDPRGANKRDQVRNDLLQYRADIVHILGTLQSYLTLQSSTATQGMANFFGTDTRMMGVLVPFGAGVADLSAYLEMLLTPLDPLVPVPPKLEQLIAVIGRASYLMRLLGYSPAEARAALDKPAAFGIVSTTSLRLLDIQTLWTFKELTRAFKDSTDALLTYLLMPDGTAEQKRARLTLLSDITGWPYDQIVTLCDLFWGTSGTEYGTVAGIVALKAVFDLGASSGLAVPALLQLQALSTVNLMTDPGAWSTLTAAASSTLSGVSAKLGDAGFRDAYAAITGTLDTAKRNALAPYLVWVLDDPHIRRLSDLYQYLLMDVEMTSCDSTSYIAQGIASVQLYLQRCHLAIEPGVVNLPIPPAWWEWMSTYRLWEVNRKIFLYPENYVDPTLRGSRTPQFAALQDELLQTTVNETTASVAMRSYLDGFATVAQLRIVGSCRADIDDGSGTLVDTTFYIGRTNTDPYTFYWRKAERYAVIQNTDGTWATVADWGPWAKIDITIAAPFVTPVYAFGKLMLFWVQFERVTNSVINDRQVSENHTVWTSTLYYSFRDFRGTWVQPQVLSGNVIVDFIPNDAYLTMAGMSPSVFLPDQMYWQRVYALRLPPTTSATLNGVEQLLVFYGNQMRFFPGIGTVPVDPCNTSIFPQGCTDFPEKTELNLEIYRAARTVQQLSPSAGDLRGNRLMKNGIYLPANLLGQGGTAVMLDTYPGVSLPPAITGEMSGGTLIVATASSLMMADYYYDATNPKTMPPLAEAAAPAPAAAGTLLAATAATNTALWTVKNQPAWFVYDNGDDVFLAAARIAPLKRISDVVHVTNQVGVYPPLNYVYTDAYTSATVDPNTVVMAFTRLGTHTIAELSQALFAGGIPMLLSPASQQARELPFSRLQPTSQVLNTTTDTLDFNGALGDYFWEVFFHSVFLIAEHLRAAGRHDEARLWFQYVYDPTAKTDDGPIDSPFDRYWRFLPFRNYTIESLVQMLTNVAAIARYNNDPFDPDAIARLRKSVYPKAVVMRYIDNLLDWGDALFAQDTRESITQATNLYVLASDLLGTRPQKIKVFQQPAPKSYNEIAALYATTGTARGGTASSITLAATASDVDSFYNGITIQITNGTGTGQSRTIAAYAGATQVATVLPEWSTVPDTTSVYQTTGIPQFLIDLENSAAGLNGPVVGGKVPYNDINAYFCVPENEELVGYWDKVEDRLFKIRHCLNLQGVERPLALFAPPLDVRSVVAAAAAPGGFTIEPTAAQAVPFFRFEVMIERAKEVTSTVSQLGSALLSALEQSDAEALNLLRNTQENALLNLTTQIRVDAINEVITSREALRQSRSAARARQDFYRGLLTAGLSPSELANLQAMEAALVFNVIATAVKTAAGIAYSIPQVGSPFAMTYGGIQIGNMLDAMAGVLEIGSYVSNFVAERTQTTAGYERRAQDWDLQAVLAGYDLAQIDQQIAASEIQQRMAERELEVHQRQLAQNQELDEFYRRRFTNRELFQWMAGRLSGIYFQTYTLAFDLARAAQSAYQYELNTNESFVKFDYRDPAYRGLLAGEGLMLSLNQMQSAWTSKRSRPLEIEKTIALSQLDPTALLALREKGDCSFDLTERLFDLDFPGHYCRKIKSISLSIPAVVGPYQNVKATLTQTSNQIVLQPDLTTVRFLLGENTTSPPGADKLRSNWWINQQIALSTGANDSGMFELNFSDPRLLPFEGTGAVSHWRLQMPMAANRFNYGSITDVVITLRYTALDGGDAFRQEVTALDPVKSYSSGRLFLLSQQFPTEWFAFMQDHAGGSQTLAFPIDESIIPPHVEDGQLIGLYVQLLVKDNADAASTTAYITANVPGQAPIPITIGANNAALVVRDLADFGGAWSLVFTLADTPAAILDATGTYLDPAKLLDIALITYYTGTLNWPAV